MSRIQAIVERASESSDSSCVVGPYHHLWMGDSDVRFAAGSVDSGRLFGDQQINQSPCLIRVLQTSKIWRQDFIRGMIVMRTVN